MSEAILNYFLHNGKILDVYEFENHYRNIHPSIYEVIRIADGVPLFLEEHYNRLLISSELLGYKINITLTDIHSSIVEMIRKNSVRNHNIKIVINNLDSVTPNEYYFFIKSSYPDEEMYMNGVDTILYEAMRDNPQAKVINHSLRESVNKTLSDTNSYEALLVNNRQEITEGSRSNLFFIKDKRVYTAPEKDVLSGITRKRIISLCRKNGIEVVETPINIRDLEDYNALFISGTSPKVLPVRKIGDLSFDVLNPTLRRIMEIYDDEIAQYIENHK